MTDGTEGTILQYSPFSSFVNPNFWHKLSKIKLDVDMLEEVVRPVWGYYTNVDVSGSPARIHIDCTAYNQDFESLHNILPAYGYHINKNTVESFKDCNKATLLEDQGIKLWNEIESGAILQNPALLSKFFLLTFGDLKKYHFYYWFAFPSPHSSNVQIIKQPVLISQAFSPAQIKSLEESYSKITDPIQKGYFLVKVTDEEVQVVPLCELKILFAESQDKSSLFVGFADPCSTEHPGWPLRNVIAALTHYCPHMIGTNISVLSLRLHSKPQTSVCSAEKSLMFIIQAQCTIEPSKWVGWERNNRGKFGPRFVNVSNDMDPSKLAENAVNLNLKLMKWRLLPNLDLDKIHNTKCLLLGAGTLGCSTARALMGWGVQHITFVDYGKVSFSNPVRQSLFTFDDCLNGGSPKAEAAAKSLEKIFPGVVSAGISLSIPMPGHTVGEALFEETRQAVSTLESLVDEHDVIFMLTDSRESRWLPTMLAASKKKLAMNAALGFDSYLVMRHGVRLDNNEEVATKPHLIPGSKLGCYFCNDITAPGNSMTDRTLDQQCTVTRPGVSSIASALVVELMVSVLQHPLEGNAYADVSAPGDSGDGTSSADCEPSLLGSVPHSIRGFLSAWQQLQPATQRFQSCIACSEMVLREYELRGFNFILDVLNSATYLEDLTGLTEMHKETDQSDMWALSDSEEEFSDS